MSTRTSATEPWGHDPEDDGTQPPELLTRAEVAALFGVSPRTVTGWANGGRLASIRTLGGHRRYAGDQVHAVLERQRRPVVDPDGHPRAEAG